MTFLAGSLGIPPSSILDYNNMIGWLNSITMQSPDKDRVRNHNKHAQLEKYDSLECGATQRSTHALVHTHQAWTVTQMEKNTLRFKYEDQTCSGSSHQIFIILVS